MRWWVRCRANWWSWKRKVFERKAKIKRIYSLNANGSWSIVDDERPARPCRPTLLGVTRSTIEDLNTLRPTSLDLNNLVEVCFIVSLGCNGSSSVASPSGV